MASRWRARLVSLSITAPCPLNEGRASVDPFARSYARDALGSNTTKVWLHRGGRPQGR